MNIDILKRPIITEKTLKIVDELNKYTFEVHPSSSKRSVKEAVEEKFKVTVLDVTIIRIPAKRVSWGKKRIQGMKSSIKKAIVTLKSSDSIDLFKVK